MFANKKSTKFLVPMIIIITMICMFIGLQKDPSKFELIGEHKKAIVFYIIFIILTFFAGRHIPDMIKIIQIKEKLGKFKQIFDNLDETILIVNTKGTNIKYVNNSFSTQFVSIMKSDSRVSGDANPAS